MHYVTCVDQSLNKVFMTNARSLCIIRFRGKVTNARSFQGHNWEEDGADPC